MKINTKFYGKTGQETLITSYGLENNISQKEIFELSSQVFERKIGVQDKYKTKEEKYVRELLKNMTYSLNRELFIMTKEYCKLD